MTTNWTKVGSFVAQANSVGSITGYQAGDVALVGWGAQRATNPYTAAAIADNGTNTGWVANALGVQSKSGASTGGTAWMKLLTATDVSDGLSTVTITPTGGSGTASNQYIQVDIFRVSSGVIQGIDCYGGKGNAAGTSIGLVSSVGSSQSGNTDELAWTMLYTPNGNGGLAVTADNYFTNGTNFYDLASSGGSNVLEMATQWTGGVSASSSAASDNWVNQWNSSVGSIIFGFTIYYTTSTNVTASAASAYGAASAQSAPPSVGISTATAAAFAWAHSHASAPTIAAGAVAAYGTGVAQGGTPVAGTGAAATAAPAFGWAGATALPASVGISTGPASAFGWGEGAAGTATAASSVTAGTASAWGSGASAGAAASAGVTATTARAAGSGTAQAAPAVAGTGVTASPASASGAGGATAGTATATSSNNALAQAASAYGHGHSHAERANVTNIVNVTYATGFAATGTPIAIPTATPDNLLRVSVVVNRSGGALPSAAQLPADNVSGQVGWEWEGVLATDGGIGAWSASKAAQGGETEIILKWSGGLGGSGTSEARILEVTNSVGGVPTLDAGASNAGLGVTVIGGTAVIGGTHPDDILLASAATDGNNGGIAFSDSAYVIASNGIADYLTEADTVNANNILCDGLGVGINPDPTGQVEFTWTNFQNWVVLGGLYYWAPNVPAQPRSAEGHGSAQAGTPSVSVTAKSASAYGSARAQAGSPIIVAGATSASGSGSARSGPIVSNVVLTGRSAYGSGVGAAGMATESGNGIASPAAAFAWAHAHGGRDLSGRAWGSGAAVAGKATATAVYFFTPPVVADNPPFLPDSRGDQVKLFRYYKPRVRGVNVFELSDGTYVQDTATPENSNTNIPYPWDPFHTDDVPGLIVRITNLDQSVQTMTEPVYIVKVFYGGHGSYQVDGPEHDALVAAGYANCLSS